MTDSENVVVETNISQEVLQEAESQGWVPKDRFKGNESEWVDADVFVKRGREILPIVRKHNEELKRDLAQTKEQLREFRAAAEEFKKFQKDSFDRKVAEYETEISELKTSRAQAISDGDGIKVNQLDEALDATKEKIAEAKQAAIEVQKQTVNAATPVTIDPVLQSWLDNNKWFGVDKRLTGIVNGIGDSLRLEFPLLTGKDFLDKLDEVLSEEFPNKFGKSKRPNNAGNMNPVESGSGRQSRVGSGSKTYDNLPSEAKAACDRFVKQKLMTREQYVKEYSWE